MAVLQAEHRSQVLAGELPRNGRAGTHRRQVGCNDAEAGLEKAGDVDRPPAAVVADAWGQGAEGEVSLFARNSEQATKRRRTMHDEQVAALSWPAPPVNELPRLPKDPLAALCPVELGLRQLDVLRLDPLPAVRGMRARRRAIRQLVVVDRVRGGRGWLAVGEDAAFGRSDPGRLLEVALFGERRDQVAAVGRIGRDV